MAKQKQTATTEQKNTKRTHSGRGRSYALGQRDPHTLPSYGIDNESYAENRVKSRNWRSLGRKIRHGEFVGAKYV